MNFIDLCSQGLTVDTSEEEIDYRDTPERKLLSAVLMRAITDLLCDSDLKAQKDARDWFLKAIVDVPDEMSFQEICLHLDIDVDSAQEAIVKLEKEAKNR